MELANLIDYIDEQFNTFCETKVDLKITDKTSTDGYYNTIARSDLDDFQNLIIDKGYYINWVDDDNISVVF